MAALTLDQLAGEAIGLPPDSRAELVRKILLSFHLEPEDAGADEAWSVELERRLERIDAGEDQGRPAEVVLAEIRARHA